jgi:hypothetical protein
VYDFGTTAVPTSIWDKPGPLTRAEFDRVELHPMLTEQMLRRSPALAVLNPVAAAHHEKSLKLTEGSDRGGSGAGRQRPLPYRRAATAQWSRLAAGRCDDLTGGTT